MQNNTLLRCCLALTWHTGHFFVLARIHFAVSLSLLHFSIH